MIIVGKTVVYGSSLDAYCCIQMLLSMGLSGDKNTPLFEQRFQFLLLNKVYMIIVGKTVVYGSSLDAYCCVQMLLSMGLSGD